ncbi:MAG: hypothetical protein ABSG46_20480 [Candidatus Binataceae bacterium]|jgi:hypothetical protein
MKGHALVRYGPRDWRCKCGIPLSDGPLGGGRTGARDVMRFHRFDLQQAILEARLNELENTMLGDFKHAKETPLKGIRNRRR